MQTKGASHPSMQRYMLHLNVYASSIGIHAFHSKMFATALIW